jgi:hypothetical protein
MSKYRFTGEGELNGGELEDHVISRETQGRPNQRRR